MSLNTSQRINNIFVILFLLSFNLYLLNCVSVKQKVVTLEQKDMTINRFGNLLRSKHLKNISKMDLFLVEMAKTDLKKANTAEIKNDIKKFFKEVTEDVNVVNQDFQKNYDCCVKRLENFSQQCDKSNEELNDDMEYNKLYGDSISKLNSNYDKLINDFYDSNIFSVTSSICGGSNDITEKNDIVEVYTKAAKMLDSHFKIFKSKDMNEILLQVEEEKSEAKVNKFLDGVVSKFTDSENQPDYVKLRHNHAQLLFNKLSVYLNNAIERKTALLKERENLFSQMKKNDEEVKTQIEKLKKGRKENSELVYSLHKDNQLLIKKKRDCDKLRNINSVCQENGNLYKTILKSYERVTKSLQKIFKVINKSE